MEKLQCDYDHNLLWGHKFNRLPECSEKINALQKKNNSHIRTVSTLKSAVDRLNGKVKIQESIHAKVIRQKNKDIDDLEEQAYHLEKDIETSDLVKLQNRFRIGELEDALDKANAEQDQTKKKRIKKNNIKTEKTITD